MIDMSDNSEIPNPFRGKPGQIRYWLRRYEWMGVVRGKERAKGVSWSVGSRGEGAEGGGTDLGFVVGERQCRRDSHIIISVQSRTSTRKQSHSSRSDSLLPRYNSPRIAF